MKRKMELMSKSKHWVNGTIIYTSVDVNDNSDTAYWRITATIEGFRKWKIYEGYIPDCGQEKFCKAIANQVEMIRDKIRNEDKTIFSSNTQLSNIS